MGNIVLKLKRDKLLTAMGAKTLEARYLLPEEKSPQDAFARAAVAFASNDAHAQRIYDYASSLWFMYSTPILTNGGTSRGLPISCFLNYVADSRDGLNEHYEENAWLSSMGGGIGGYWGEVRSDGVKTSKGSQSSGSIPFMKIVDAQMLAFSQGVTRRGSYAAYQDISHPEIEEFINFRKPSGGDINRKCLNLHHGVNITDEFMDAVTDGKPWELIDPHSKKVTKTIDARELWQTLLETRIATGEPYLHFIDTTNNALPQVFKDKGLTVKQSNLCSEITLVTDELRTAVCCLSSVNLAKWDEWKDNELFISDLVEYLDNVLEYFIKNAPPELSKAVYSAMTERSIGLGAMGFHSYLQSKNIPYESAQAVGQTRLMFKHIKAKAVAASERLATERGEPELMEGTGRRNAHLLAIAPNASSSIICGGTSPSIEPIKANAYTHKTLSGSFLIKNDHLDKIITERVQDQKERDAIWKAIITNKGSVQHLPDYVLTAWEKDVFKTAVELNQEWVIEHASYRQAEVCQSQSVNIFLPPDVHVTVLHNVHYNAWVRGLKSLYYLRSEAPYRADNISSESVRAEINTNECLSCEG